MKKILVPIDFTEYSKNAFRMAAYMARVKGMSIKLLHVIEEPIQIEGVPFINKDKGEMIELKKNTEEHLRRMAALEKIDEIDVQYEVRTTKKAIAKEILNEECDLIIMGRRRPLNAEVFWTGSVAEKTIRLSSIPVITVGELSENYAINNIVFASDFEEPEIAPIIQRVIDLAAIFKANLNFLCVVINREILSEKTSEKSVRERLNKFDLKDHDVNIYFAASQEEGIRQYVDDTGADLLALCTHARSGFSQFFIGSIAENMAAYAGVPVLTYSISKKKIERAARPIKREKIILRKKREENL
jgi:nucleotide-binding universal stress UspA family protein